MSAKLNRRSARHLRGARAGGSGGAASSITPPGYVTHRATVGSDRFRADAKIGVTSGPVMIHACGFTSDENTMANVFNSGLLWRPALLEAGWIVASCDFSEGESWGNSDSQASMDALITWLDSTFGTVTHIVIEGLSAGGLVALNRVTAGSYDDRIRGIALGNAVCDLAAIYAVNNDPIWGDAFPTSIDTAYGITNPPNYATATSGFDPVLELAAAYDVTSASGHKLRFIHFASTDDTVVVKATHADALDTLIGSGSWESTVTATTGNHYFAEAYGTSAQWMSFFERCIIDWPIAEVAGTTSNKAAAASVNLTIPTGTVEGDLLVACLGAEGTSVTTITASGWTVEAANAFSTNAYGLLYRTATADDETNAGTGTHTFSCNGTPTGIGGQMVRVQRALTSDPFGSIGGGLASSTAPASSGITIDGYNRLGFAFIYASADVTVVWPAGWTELGQCAAGGAGMTVSTAVKLMPNSGASGGFTATLGSSAIWFAVETQIHPVE